MRFFNLDNLRRRATQATTVVLDWTQVGATIAVGYMLQEVAHLVEQGSISPEIGLLAASRIAVGKSVLQIVRDLKELQQLSKTYYQIGGVSHLDKKEKAIVAVQALAGLVATGVDFATFGVVRQMLASAISSGVAQGTFNYAERSMVLFHNKHVARGDLPETIDEEAGLTSNNAIDAERTAELTQHISYARQR